MTWSEIITKATEHHNAEHAQGDAKGDLAVAAFLHIGEPPACFDQDLALVDSVQMLHLYFFEWRMYSSNQK